MNTKNAQLLMDETRKEIKAIRESAVKRKKQPSKFPDHIWKNISILMDHYSRSEIISNLSLFTSQYSKVKAMKIPIESSAKKAVKIKKIKKANSSWTFLNLFFHILFPLRIQIFLMEIKLF